MPCIKGKTTRSKPAPVVDDYIDIPKELFAAQREITLCMDGMKVKGYLFFPSSLEVYNTEQHSEKNIKLQMFIEMLWLKYFVYTMLEDIEFPESIATTSFVRWNLSFKNFNSQWILLIHKSMFPKQRGIIASSRNVYKRNIINFPTIICLGWWWRSWSPNLPRSWTSFLQRTGCQPISALAWSFNNAT